MPTYDRNGLAKPDAEGRISHHFEISTVPSAGTGVSGERSTSDRVGPGVASKAVGASVGVGAIVKEISRDVGVGAMVASGATTGDGV